jgi:DNA excision repair protein ERCC-2
VSESAARTLKVAVRTLAELTCRQGDIHFRYDDATTEAQEGIALQKRLQCDRPPSYQREVAVSGRWCEGGIELAVTGRADGYDGEQRLVEEFKTTRADPARLFEHIGEVHRAQLRIYAALLAQQAAADTSWQLRLLYCHPDTLAVATFDERLSTAQLSEFYAECCAKLAAWIGNLRRHRNARDAQLRALPFPYRQFRPTQHRLAADVYRTVRDGGALLLEAPTGSGKTLGTLFPALRAVGEGLGDRVVFLSARSTGQRAAEAALRQLDPSASLRRVTITAKAKVCFMPEPVCDPDICPYARGYYDRSEAAVRELLSMGEMNRGAIEVVARAHGVCPFELSLDAAVGADVVVCDYNYVFDPVVHLKRLNGVDRDRVVLLVDEAHQLGERVREGFSTAFSRAMLRDYRRSASGSGNRLAAALDRRLTELRREAVTIHGLDRDAFECTIAWPEKFARSAQLLYEALAENPDPAPLQTELAFALARFLRGASWFEPGRYAVVLRGRGRDIDLEVRCLDPADEIAKGLQPFPAHVRFSATVSPFELFARSHGQPAARTLRLPSPFPPGRLGAFVVNDVDTRYRARHATLTRLVTVLQSFVGARQGNYLIALPSFQYLECVAAAFAERTGAEHCRRQSRGMTDAERHAFLAQFTSGSCNVGFVVLGGVFAESIDLPTGALTGMAVVGIGLPPPTMERDAIVARFGAPLGRMVAYEQPALTRVVQAAGRLIRRPEDRAALCLIDTRYEASPYRDLLPAHWQLNATSSARLATLLDDFWNNG